MLVDAELMVEILSDRVGLSKLGKSEEVELNE